MMTLWRVILDLKKLTELLAKNRWKMALNNMIDYASDVCQKWQSLMKTELLHPIKVGQ
jgi:hypothetical protein